MAPTLGLLASIGTLLGVLMEAPIRTTAATLRSGGSARGPSFSGRKNSCDHVIHYSATATSSGSGAGYSGFVDHSSESVPSMPWPANGRRVPRNSGILRKRDADRATFAVRGGSSVVTLRGGSTLTSDGQNGEERGGMGVLRSLKVLVSTTKISSYVDARGEIAAQSDWTVGRLKEELEKKFPGKIPASLQRLFKGTQLLSSEMTLEEAAEGAEGPLSLLLDNAPPIDASRFDPDTAVPSRRDGQVEAFSACLAAQSSLQEDLLAVMRGDSGQGDPDLTRSVKMKADFENTQALLRRTLQEVPETNADEKETFGILHEALRPLAHSLDVNWLQSAQYALFAYICAQFGAQGAVRQFLTLMLIPTIFLAQTRRARVALKLARNLVAEIPVLTQLFIGLLQAPGQAILSLDTAAYTRDLYGPGGPKYDAAFLEREEDDEAEAAAEE